MVEPDAGQRGIQRANGPVVAMAPGCADSVDFSGLLIARRFCRGMLATMDAADSPTPTQGAEAALLRGVWSFLAVMVSSLVAPFFGEEIEAYVNAAALLAWIPGIRALLLLAEGLGSRGLWRATIGMFWSFVLLEVVLHGVDSQERTAEGLVVIASVLATLGIVVYMFHDPAKRAAGADAESRLRPLVGVGIGLLIVLKVLAKGAFATKYWAVRGLGRLFADANLEMIELVLFAALGLLAFGSLMGFGIVLVRRGRSDPLLRTAGWLSLLAVAAELAIVLPLVAEAIGAPAAAANAPVATAGSEPRWEDLAGQVPQVGWQLTMVWMLLQLRARAMAAPGRSFLTDG